MSFKPKFQITFDKFLKENDANSVESIKRVEEETRRKLEKVAAVKKLHNTIRGIETEISKSASGNKPIKLQQNPLMYDVLASSVSHALAITIGLATPAAIKKNITLSVQVPNMSTEHVQNSLSNTYNCH